MSLFHAVLPRWRQAGLSSRHDILNISRFLRQRVPQSRLESSSTQKSSATAQIASRFDRFIAKTPTKFLRSRLQALKNAPLTHITSFLILHEITAIVPLFGLAGAFHYYQWLPPYFAEGEWVLKGVTLFGNYFRRKGWITSSDAASAKDAAEKGREEDVEKAGTKGDTIGKWWDRGEGGTRLVIEFATAYAIVKVLMPLRIVISVWGAPWFARWTVVPLQSSFKRFFGKKKPVHPAGIKSAKDHTREKDVAARNCGKNTI